MKYIVLLLTSCMTLFISSCNKEGKGGGATIQGKVITEYLVYNPISGLTPIDTFDAQDEKIYIVYGDNETFDDDTRTAYNGNFKFDYLYEGEYTIYMYSDCVQHIDSCPSGNNTILKTIIISSANEVVDVSEILIQQIK